MSDITINNMTIYFSSNGELGKYLNDAYQHSKVFKKGGIWKYSSVMYVLTMCDTIGIEGVNPDVFYSCLTKTWEKLSEKK